MRLHFIKARRSFVGSRHINLYHLAMFHGHGERTGAKYPGLDYHLGDKLRYPLHLVKNVYRIAPVFQPNLNLIVCPDLQRTLADLSNVAWLQVRYARLFSVPYEKGTLPRASIRDVTTILARYPDEPGLHATIPSYYEMIVPVAQTIFAGAKKHREAEVRLPDGRVYSIPVSSRISTSHPIYWDSGLMIADDVFGIMEPYLDFDYFIHVLVDC